MSFSGLHVLRFLRKRFYNKRLHARVKKGSPISPLDKGHTCIVRITQDAGSEIRLYWHETLASDNILAFWDGVRPGQKKVGSIKVIFHLANPDALESIEKFVLEKLGVAPTGGTK